jgi:glycosyltransferase involved in cell wall biosynthesis
MHILTALTYYRPHYSGLTIYTERVAAALARRGHQVTILTSRFDPSLPAEEMMDGVKVVRLGVAMHISKGVIMPGMLSSAWQLSRQADIIHLHTPQLDAAAISLFGRLLGKPVVLTHHCDLRLPSGWMHRLANQVSNLANLVTASSSNVIIHNSRDYAENSPFLRRYLNQLHPVPPPVEVAPVSPEQRAAFRQKFNLQPGQRIIGMVSRLATEKGVEHLAQALPIILQQIPQARLLFVGPYQNVVGEEAYARRLAPLIEQVGEHWSFLGVLTPVELAAFYHECEVTVLPSINSTESYGIVQVESMACGAPVVASNLPGVRVPVTETGMGVVIPVANSSELARAVIEILNDPGSAKGHPQNLLARSTPDAVAEEYEKIFTSLLHPAQNALPNGHLSVLPSQVEETGERILPQH